MFPASQSDLRGKKKFKYMCMCESESHSVMSDSLYPGTTQAMEFSRPEY